jgi:hypothetical protein
MEPRAIRAEQKTGLLGDAAALALVGNSVRQMAG